MPELPEVESVRRQLAPEVTGRTILNTWTDGTTSSRYHAIDAAIGGRIQRVNRRGKYLLVALHWHPATDLELVLHLGMTGSLRFSQGVATDAHSAQTGPHSGHAPHPHDRVAFALDDDRTLVFRDMRRFGRVSVVTPGDYATVVPTLATIGPEPLTPAFDAEEFARALRSTHAPVKAVLLNQRVVAGVGNIYADEALWRAKIHPASRRVGTTRAVVLHQTIRDVLTEAIAREGTTFRDYQMVNGASGRFAAFLTVYGKAGTACQRCGTTLQRSIVAQRGTTFCPRCQRV